MYIRHFRNITYFASVASDAEGRVPIALILSQNSEVNLTMPRSDTRIEAGGIECGRETLFKFVGSEIVSRSRMEAVNSDWKSVFLRRLNVAFCLFRDGLP